MKKILFAEDNTHLRSFLTGILEKEGYNIRAFDNGLKAWEYYQGSDHDYNLLLTDLVMPEMGGVELARNIYKLNPEIKILFITGFSFVALKVENKFQESAGVVSKPFHLKELIKKINQIFEEIEYHASTKC